MISELDRQGSWTLDHTLPTLYPAKIDPNTLNRLESNCKYVLKTLSLLSNIFTRYVLSCRRRHLAVALFSLSSGDAHFLDFLSVTEH